MPRVLFSLIVFSVFCFAEVFSQGAKDPIKLTVGVEMRALVPISFFTMDSLVLSDEQNNFRSVTNYEGGFGFGGVLRANLTKIWNFETGLYYTRRRYNYTLTDPSVGFDEDISLRVISYEIPIKGLVYIQMADNIYMNVALGVSTNFVASDIESLGNEYIITAFKRSWANFAVLGNIGVEFRTEKEGYFYLGGTIHQPFSELMSTQVNYFRGGDPPAYFDNGTLGGAYFSIDFRFFFPPQVSKKPKVNYVTPDWKNM
jgi:hypothetical protein